MSSENAEPESGRSLYDVEASDPESRLVDRSGLSREDIAQINRLMSALSQMRKAEDLLSEASTRYMKLNKTDMRALHYLIVCGHRGELVTPGALAVHLGISTASVTKLLDRLERAGHIVREAHPSDRRALQVTITAETKHSAMDTVGRQQAKRFAAAARLSCDEREVVIGFLEAMARELSLEGVSWAQEA